MKRPKMVPLDEDVRVVGLVDEHVGGVKGGEDDRWRVLIKLRPWRRVTRDGLEKLELVVTCPVTGDQLALLQERLPMGKAVELHVHLREAWPQLLNAELLDMEVRPAKRFEATRAPNPVRPASAPFPKLAWTAAGWAGKADFPGFAGFRDGSGPYGKLRGVSKRGAARVSVKAESPASSVSPARVAGYRNFLADQSGAVAAVVEALVREAPRLAGCYPVFPTLRSIEDVMVHIGLHCVHVRPDRRIGLEFGCTWDREHGLGMILSGTKIIALATADLSFEGWTRRKTRARSTRMASPRERAKRRR